MARPIGKETKKENVKKALETAIPKEKKTDAVYLSRLERYMEFYDNLLYVNERITTLKQAKPPDDKLILSLIGEARRIENQLLEIEKYFGYNPKENTDVGSAHVPL